MTDEQIVDALMHCACDRCGTDCPFAKMKVDFEECTTELAKNALFLIRRLQRKIDDLEQDVADLEETNGYLHAELDVCEIAEKIARKLTEEQK